MEKKKNINVPKFNLDDFFTTQEQRDDNNKEKIEILELSLIDSFPNHPFKVIENDDLRKLEESIHDNGILEPLIVRKKENGRFEIISGHRRKRASELIGNKTIPCIVRDLNDDEATIFMVDSNVQREQILPSEKAFAYKMKLNALSNQGKRNDLTSSPMDTKLETASLIGKEQGDSKAQVYRYIRLCELIPELLNMVDNSVLDGKPAMALRPAVELSYLSKNEQLLILDNINYSDSTPSHAQAIKFRKLSQENKLNSTIIDEIMSQEKPNQIPKIKLSEDKIKKIIPNNLKINNMEEFILRAVEYYGKHLRERNRDQR